ncbi:hypothetical protein GCM10010350_64960 [Streptomyces galilaeus]|nr:hypothetical protein GCM10010350_64960 [Streptomyces galilaeus]
MTALHSEGADEVRRGRPWGLPLEDRVLMVVAYWHTNLTLRRLALLFGVSKSAADRVIAQLGPLLALQPRQRCRKDTVPVVEGTAGRWPRGTGRGREATDPFGRRWVIQCKHRRKGLQGPAVGTPDLQVLNGTARQVHGADIAVIVTNGRVPARPRTSPNSSASPGTAGPGGTALGDVRSDRPGTRRRNADRALSAPCPTVWMSGLGLPLRGRLRQARRRARTSTTAAATVAAEQMTNTARFRPPLRARTAYGSSRPQGRRRHGVVTTGIHALATRDLGLGHQR